MWGMRPSPSVGLDVRRIVSAPFEVNTYVVREGDEALVIDASSGLDWSTFAPGVLKALEGATARAFHLTHLHVDHVGGAARMSSLLGVRPTIHDDEAIAVEQGDATLTGGALFGVPQEACDVRRVRAGDVIELGPKRFEVLLVPGHSPAHTALWEQTTGSLFPGDVVFEGGSFGRVDLPGCDPRLLLRSLERLAALPVRDMFPGHMRPVMGNAREAIDESLDNARLMLG